MVTFVCWLWKGWRPIYDARHVNRLHSLLAKHMTGDWRLICVTDDTTGIDCETFPLWTMPRATIPGRLDVRTEGQMVPGTLDTYTDNVVPDCFTRLRMFDPGVGRHFGERFVSIDLDCVILKDLAPLFANSEDFVASKGYRSYLCGSMWQLRPGTNQHVWTSYDPVASPKQIAGTMHNGRHLSGSDQAWMSIQMPTAPLWTETDGVYQLMELRPQRTVPKNARIVFFAGAIKPWDGECAMINRALYTPL